MSDFKPTPRQRTILDRLRLTGGRLVHIKGKTSKGAGLYALDAAGAETWQPRTIRPLIEHGLIRPSQIREVQL